MILPPDPSSIAPPVDNTVATSVYSSTQFLYTGDNAVQTGMAPETIDIRRAAVLRGKVMTADNAALSGVIVTILNHPEFGQTFSRIDGMFDLAANGGGLLTVNYAKPGYLSAQRQVKVPWQDYTVLPDVVMIPYDNQLTTIDLHQATPIQVARGSVSSDERGTRQATLFFPQGTQATMTLPDGSSRPLSTMSVRATEYTVGPNGPKAMPAALPPATGYTYCVELSVDEAAAIGASRVEFDRPVPFYVDNFLGIPVGTQVPVGFYDRTLGSWIAAPDGRVVKVLSVTGGLANLDTDGNGAADNAAVLATLGITDDELRQIASLYPSGKTLWRAALTHFSPADFNYSYICQGACEPPKQGPSTSASLIPPGPCNNVTTGSIIECQSQTLRETVSVAGTSFSLNYGSNRVRGRKDNVTLTIPLSGPVVPLGVKRIDLAISIAGQAIQRTFDNSANQEFTYAWEGQDAYGRVPQGEQSARVNVDYVYDAAYAAPPQQPSTFGLPGTEPIPGVPARIERIVFASWVISLGTWDARAQGLGGWTLNIHHAYDPMVKKLYLGDGTVRGTVDMNKVIFNHPTPTSPSWPFGIAATPDGAVYYSDSWKHQVYRVEPDGTGTRIAGAACYYEPCSLGYSGDGVRAVDALLNYPSGVAVDGDNNVYISDLANCRVRRVDRNGIITTVAGTGAMDYNGDNIPATQAMLYSPRGLAIGPDGSLYIADDGTHRIRRVGLDGIITTVAGTGTRPSQGAFGGDGGLATQASLNAPWGLGFDSNGNLYIADIGNHRIRRVSPDGIITTVAGSGQADYNGDGGPALLATLNYPTDVAVGKDGSLYIADAGNDSIRRVGSDEIITTVAGSGVHGYGGDGGPAAAARFGQPTEIDIGPNGDLFISDGYNHKIRRVSSAFPGLSISEIVIAGESGNELYVFDESGRHLRTLHSLTGATLYHFTYNVAGDLIRVADADNNVTQIERRAVGYEPFVRYIPAAIVAPGGQRTTLDVDSNPGWEYLSQVTNPAGDTVHLTYKSDGSGLLERLDDQRGYAHLFAYDSLGRLERDDDPAGGYKTLVRSEALDGDRYEVSVGTALGRTTTYSVEPYFVPGLRIINPDGTYTDRPGQVLGSLLANSSPSGAQSRTRGYLDMWIQTEHSDNTVSFVSYGSEPRFGMQAPISDVTVWTPGGQFRDEKITRTAILANAGDLLSLRTQTDTTTVNGRTYTTVYDNATLRFTTTTPAGRQTVSGIDDKGRPISIQIDSAIAPMTFSYHPNGRLYQAGQDNNLWTSVYDAKNRLWKKTDPLDNTVEYGYDEADRVNMVKLPSGRTYLFGYDRAGNRTSITMPDGNVHLLDYTPVNLDNAYTPPLNPAYAHGYTLDREWDNTVLPSGRLVKATYDGGARLESIVYPEAAVTYGYADNTERVFSVTRTDALDNSVQGTTFAYDGFLTTMAAASGAANGEYRYAYDNNFWLTRIAIDNVWNVLSRDDDGLLTGNGPFTIRRLGPAGAPDNVSDLLPRTCGLDNTGLPVDCLPGALLQTYGYDNTGRLNRRTMIVNGSVSYEAILERGRAGRIVQKTETVGAAPPVVWRYDYDVDGQLDNVWRDGIQWEHYGYDNNANRTSTLTASATYDNQDRLIQQGGVLYQFDADGYLAQRGADTFTYSARGELLSATVGVQTVTYQYDGTGRRVARTDAQGAVTQYLYGNLSNPFQVTASRAPYNVLTVYYYDDYNALYALERGGTRYYVASDHLGTPKVITDNTGNIVRQVEYDSWGVKTSDTNPGFDLPVGFAGGIPDDTTGPVRFGFRDYEPATGRWAAKDPIFFRGGQGNLFNYVANDPLNGIDPSGLEILNLFSGIGPLDLSAYDVEGAIVVIAHGTYASVFDERRGVSIKDVKELALIIRTETSWKSGMTVILASCNSGSANPKGLPSIAERLASELHSDVWGINRTITSGGLFEWPRFPFGGWKRFPAR